MRLKLSCFRCVGALLVLSRCSCLLAVEFPVTEEELEKQLRDGCRFFEGLLVTSTWHGRSLAEVGGQPIRFQKCTFTRGINFQNLKIESPLVFDRCNFGSVDTVTGGPRATDNLIQGCFSSEAIRFLQCEFYWDMRLYNDVFTGLFVSDTCIYYKTFTLEDCSFGGRFRVSNGEFDDYVRIQASDFNNSVDVTTSKFAKTFSVERTHISGDLILESGRIISLRGEAPDEALALNETIVAGELNFDHFEFNSGQTPQPSRIRIQESTIGDIRGISWNDFRTVFRSADRENEAEVLAQLRHSYLQLGQTGEAGKTLLALKANDAEDAGMMGLFIDRVMRYTSGWGTQPWLLMCWFGGIVITFTAWYAVLVVSCRGYRHIPSILVECFVLSISTTLLQSDPKGVEELSPKRGAGHATLREVILFHKIVASLFLMLVAAYIGSTLSYS